MRKLGEMLTPEHVVDLRGKTKREVLRELVDVIATAPEVTDPKAFLAAILAREEIMSTGIGIGIAIPHAKISSVTDFVMAVGRSRQGVDFDSLDDRPVHLVFMVGASDRQRDDFLKVLAHISLLLKNRPFKMQLLEAQGSAAMLELLRDK